MNESFFADVSTSLTGRRWKRRVGFAFAVWLGALLTPGCGAQDSGTGNTNWKVECDRTEECPGTDVCQCGVCGPRCDGTLDCAMPPEQMCTMSSSDGGPSSDPSGPNVGPAGPSDAATDDEPSVTPQPNNTSQSEAGPGPGPDSTSPSSPVSPDASTPSNDGGTEPMSPDPVTSDSGISADDADVVIDCTAFIGQDSTEVTTPGQRGLLIGNDGQFLDTCRDDGNLRQYSCEVYSPDRFAGVPATVTGEVRSNIVDCDGRCVDGRCEVGCPETGDAAHVVEVLSTGETIIENLEDGRRFGCLLANQSEGADCLSLNDATGTFTGTTLQSGTCAGGWVGNFAVDVSGGNCGYSGCRKIYDDESGSPPVSDLRYDATESIVCTAGERPDRGTYYGGDVGVRSTLQTASGEVQDTCVGDVQREYLCETRIIGDCVDLPNAPACPREFTGEAVGYDTNCGGQCTDGQCPTGCPAFYDRLLIEAQPGDGSVVVADLTNDRRYQCTVSTTTGDQVECAQLDGRDAFIVSRGVSTPCPGTQVGSFGICLPDTGPCQSNQCTFTDCQRLFD